MSSPRPANHSPMPAKTLVILEPASKERTLARSAKSPRLSDHSDASSSDETSFESVIGAIENGFDVVAAATVPPVVVFADATLLYAALPAVL